jgi:hypothetical protein
MSNISNKPTVEDYKHLKHGRDRTESKVIKKVALSNFWEGCFPEIL